MILILTNKRRYVHGSPCSDECGSQEGDLVTVVGDGAVGLCAIIASKRLGADRIIALSRNPSRQKLARIFGATDIATERGEEATKKVMELTSNLGVDDALECVGTGESMTTAFSMARPGSVIGAIGAPHGVVVPIDTVIFRNVGLRGGVAPVRRYIPDLLDDVLHLNGIKEAHAMMNDRLAVKSLLKMGDI